MSSLAMGCIALWALAIPKIQAPLLPLHMSHQISDMVLMHDPNIMIDANTLALAVVSHDTISRKQRDLRLAYRLLGSPAVL